MPPSLITAAAAGAATGKNPWLPFGILFALARLPRVPGWVIDAELHAGLHDLVPPGLCLGLAIVFLLLAVLDSAADKIHWVECWLTPLSAVWRPFAAVGVSFLIARAASEGQNLELLGPLSPVPISLAPDSGLPDWWLLGSLAGEGSAGFADAGAEGSMSLTLGGVALFSATMITGTLFGLLATFGKIGTRLLLAFVPIPTLKLAHSLLDDLFAFCVTVVGIVAAHTWLAPFAAAAGLVYLAIGVVVGPVLARLTFIQLRVGWQGFVKLVGARAEPQAGAVGPRWLRRTLEREQLDPSRAVIVPGYVYRARGVGLCRAGIVVWLPQGIRFLAPGWFGTKVFRVDASSLSRVGLSTTTTARQLVVVEQDAAGPHETTIVLFPAAEAEIRAAVDRGTSLAGLVRVKANSGSARQGLPGNSPLAKPGAYVSAAQAGDLNFQGVVTVFTAALVGILSVGTFVPIGAGYLFSPFRRRFLLCLFISAYLLLWSLTIAGWPLAVLYAVACNVVALRDLTRQAHKARIDGYVDPRKYLPPVCGQVWVPAARLLDPMDRWTELDEEPFLDGSWRAVIRRARRVQATAVP